MGIMDSKNGFLFEEEILKQARINKAGTNANRQTVKGFKSGGFIIPLEMSTAIIKESILQDAINAFLSSGVMEKDQIAFLIERYKMEQMYSNTLKTELKKEKTSKKWYKDRYKKR